MEKDGYPICSIYIGNTSVDLYGYDNEIEYAYIGDENVSEMFNELGVWDYVRTQADNERPWHG